MSLVASFVAMCQPLSLVLTAPSFASLLTLLCGWVFASHHTVTAMKKAAGALSEKHFSSYHRFLSLARWNRDELGLCIFGLLLPLCSDVVLLSVDDTLCRKFGRKKRFGCGMHHDAISSSRNQAIVNWGHSWVILAVVVRLPVCKKRVFSLPILVRLYLNHKACAKWRVSHRTRCRRARTRSPRRARLRAAVEGWGEPVRKEVRRGVVGLGGWLCRRRRGSAPAHGERCGWRRGGGERGAERKARLFRRR